jgi:hypothetical protein
LVLNSFVVVFGPVLRTRITRLFWRGEWKNVRNSVWKFGTGTRNAGGARACFPNGKVKLLAPHTSGPRDVPRCGALSLLQKDAALQGGIQQKPL